MLKKNAGEGAKLDFKTTNAKINKAWNKRNGKPRKRKTN
jgi:hypothetical protein